MATQKAILSYLDRYVPMFEPHEECQVVEPDAKYVFSLWLQGEDSAPDIVKACWRSVRHNSNHELIILDDRTIFDWVELPDYIVDKWYAGKIKPAHFADICRVELLHCYGGLWMDATDFLFADFPQWLLDEDFFVYLSGDCLKGFYSAIQNCFIRSRKGSYLLEAWRNAIFVYWKYEDSAIDYFIHQLLFKKVVDTDSKAAKYFQRMPQMIQDPSHVLWYEYADRPFDRKILDDITSSSLFQKAEYKSPSARSPQKGTFADMLINEMYK